MSETKVKSAHVWERNEHDWYVEPEVATLQLLSQERFVGRIHDPCCGQGNIVRSLIASGYPASGSDVVDRTGGAGWFKGESDFLSDRACFADNIVMNPPFFKAKGAEAFIRKALSVARGKVAAFVDVRFISGAGRANDLFAEFAPDRVWILTPRVSCPPGEVLLAGGKATGGTADWCWLVWDKTAPFTGTTLNWLRRSA
ncbi:hypothetical protein H9Q09_00910 [Aurantimonas sp. DM33-3]|uniref:hypothetical protein n=1 Tax=Aurantimonas sp. DM33-3 TaxID=2766955 RepID=UPI001651DC72|nr:hypothetical protein [Aurantimonas sp. DM33-3]MBC6714744.1 hypothetical protein [Aurantimonas sp. DM33-3]